MMRIGWCNFLCTYTFSFFPSSACCIYSEVYQCLINYPHCFGIIDSTFLSLCCCICASCISSHHAKHISSSLLSKLEGSIIQKQRADTPLTLLWRNIVCNVSWNKKEFEPNPRAPRNLVAMHSVINSLQILSYSSEDIKIECVYMI